MMRGKIKGVRIKAKDAVLPRKRARTKKKAAEAARSADDDEETGVAADYYPYKPYCSVCDRDLTTVTSYDDETTELSYTCVCSHHETVRLSGPSASGAAFRRWSCHCPIRRRGRRSLHAPE